MTSEIEAKRKELEKKINNIYISGKTDGHKSRKLRNKKAELNGFNLGVEMAREEFNDLLDEITKAYLYNDACDCGGCLKAKEILLKVALLKEENQKPALELIKLIIDNK